MGDSKDKTSMEGAAKITRAVVSDGRTRTYVLSRPMACGCKNNKMEILYDGI